MTLMARLAELAQPVTQHPRILRIRRNHGLEHATIHVLNGRGYRLSGRSSAAGFILLGDVPTEQVESAVVEALARMKAGERKLAIHPNCGTNLVTTGFLATAAAFIGFAGRGLRRGWQRFPSMMIVMMAVVLLSMPLGLSLQRHFTTAGDPGELELVSVERDQMRLPFNHGRITLHRVVTRPGQ